MTLMKNKQAFDHIMDVILDNDLDSPVVQALSYAGCEERVTNLYDMTEKEIANLVYPELQPDQTYIDRRPHVLSISGMLRRWRAFLDHRMSMKNPLEPEDYVKLEYSEFKDFINQFYIPQVNLNIPPPPSAGKTTTDNPIDSFKKGIKRDSSVYPVLKQDSQFDVWKRETLAYAKAQGCHDVFDPTYTPLGTESITLFELQKDFVYATFVTNLQTDVGRKLVRSHTDAQLIYTELLEYYEKSGKASLDSDTILEYIFSIRYSDSWRGTTHSFVLHLQEQFRQLRRITEPKDHLTPAIERRMIEKAVKPVPTLHMVKTQAQTMHTMGLKLDNDAYFQLLIAAAIEHDSKTATPSRLRRNPVRSTHLHESYPDDQGQDEDVYDVNFHDAEYDIDTPLDTILANMHNRAYPRGSPGYIPTETMSQLSDTGREMWMQMTPSDRAVIFGLQAKSGSTSQPKSSTPGRFNKSRPPPNKRRVNLHEVSAYDFIVMQHEFLNNDSIEATESATTTETTNTPEPVVQVNNTSIRKEQLSVAPSDIRKVMGSTSAKKVTVNGIDRYSTNMTMIRADDAVYKVSAHASRATAMSLVDRGSNGGVAGQDVRIIERHPHRTVTIEGIDSHQMNNIPICTVGGVVNTTDGPIILVLPHYAYVGRGATIHSPGQFEYYGTQVHD